MLIYVLTEKSKQAVTIFISFKSLEKGSESSDHLIVTLYIYTLSIYVSLGTQLADPNSFRGTYFRYSLIYVTIL